jgi:mandelamide amidase
MTYTRNTAPASVVGLPAISLPMGLSTAGLPMGIELDGPEGSDRRLLALAASLEALLPAMPAPARSMRGA